jgi:hypothetical protein
MKTPTRTRLRSHLAYLACPHCLVTCLALLALLLGPVGNAAASLGGDASTVQTDRVRMQGALLRVVGNGAYTLHEVQAASGTVVRQYLSSTGAVVAIAWRGPSIPDLRQLLGVYFDRFQQAADAARRTRPGRGPLTINLGDLVVQSSGHARAFSGQAYLPSHLPQGLRPSAIR